MTSFRVRFHTNRDEIDTVTPEAPRNDPSVLVVVHENGEGFTAYPWNLITTPVQVYVIKENE